MYRVPHRIYDISLRYKLTATRLHDREGNHNRSIIVPRTAGRMRRLAHLVGKSKSRSADTLDWLLDSLRKISLKCILLNLSTGAGRCALQEAGGCILNTRDYLAAWHGGAHADSACGGRYTTRLPGWAVRDKGVDFACQGSRHVPLTDVSGRLYRCRAATRPGVGCQAIYGRVRSRRKRMEAVHFRSNWSSACCR